METVARIERALEAAIAPAAGFAGPPRLAAAVRHAVFPGGARVRPRLCLAVAQACGNGAFGSDSRGQEDNALADAAAVSLELIHCASLVHDDLPCFDAAEQRRGQASVQHAFGESLAVLAGDALIVLAFETIALAASAPATPASSLAPLLLLLSRATGLPRGIIAGQAWECEPEIPLAAYHRAKTASLFSAATMAGALAAGAEPGPWHALGERLGEAYQVADDIRDVIAIGLQFGKPGGRDQALGRPSAAVLHGVPGAIVRLKTLVHEAIEAIPPCPQAADLRELIRLEMRRLLPQDMLLQAA